MPRSHYLLVFPVSLLAVLVAVTPAAAQASIHRNGFGGRDPFWAAADANIKFDEKAHKISDEHCKNAPTSEYIKIDANPPAGAVDAEYVHYAYDTPPAPITDRLTASVWVKSYRAGVQIRARVVLPKEKDPKNPDAPLTALILGDSYKNVRQWQPLTLGNPEDLLRKHMPVLHARVGHAVDSSGAYIDRLMLNVYAGPGITEVWVDDLEIGPVKVDPNQPAGPKPKTPGTVASRPGATALPKARTVEFRDGQVKIDGEPFFMLAIRHTDTPLKTLRDANINTVWFPAETAPETIEEAVRQGFWIVPSVPLPAAGFEPQPRNDAVSMEREANRVADFLRRFLSTDAVLMWDLGGGRTSEEVARVARTASAVREVDPRRPRGVDLWDGFQNYSSYVDAVGTHRWPLFTSLELNSYKDWLAQRKSLTSPSKMTWTWVQTHLPDWYVRSIAGKADVTKFDDPVGPHPEQIRILTYLSLAAGNRGIGYWSDRFLANTHHGRDRLLELAMLNTEIEMLKPVLNTATEPAKWIGTSDGNVQAAILRGPKEVLVLPVWLGAGTQYTPAQGALPSLSVTVPLVPDGAIPWLVSPVGVTELKDVKRVAGGTRITIPEFDLTAAVVFTSDLKLDGKIVRWQDHTRYRVGELAARWAEQQAIEQHNKTLAIHNRITQSGGPEVAESQALLARSEKYIANCKEYLENKQWDTAFREARRAQRPLRVLMREDWRKAVEGLDCATASPFAVSFYSLPLHWQLAKDVAGSKPGATVLPYGRFELSGPAPDQGAAVASLPGWSTRQSLLDPVVAVASIVNSDKLADVPPPKVPLPPTRYVAPQFDTRPEDVKLKPELGKQCLRLDIAPKVKVDKAGNPLPAPQALERAFLAVDSPAVDLPPGSLARVSFWAKVPKSIESSADGVVVYDSAGGEPLAVRLQVTDGWQRFNLYRRVPEGGKLSMTFALTGIGTAYIDDVKIEPLVPSGGPVQAGGAAPAPRR